jgi:putative ABC transport system permease protein
LNVRIFAFALAVSLVTALFLGLVTAWRACRVDLGPVLKEGAETVRLLRSWFSLRNALVSGQIAMSLILLMGMGLFLRSLLKLQSIDAGLSGRQVLVLSLDLQEQRYTPQRGKSFYADALERISALPEVKSASLASAVPVTMGGRRMDLPPNFTNPPVNEPTAIDIISVAPRFFETIGLPLLRGRDFGPLDYEKGPKAIIVNETMARIFWPDSDPVGRRLLIGKSAFEVVAVARDTKYRELRETARTTMYTPLAQSYRPRMNVLVRTAGPPMDLAPIVREQLRALDPTLPAFDLRTLSEHVGRSLYIERIQSLLTSALGLLGLLLTSVGVYGMAAQTVAQRTHEIGMRMALGAQAGAVRTLMLRRSLYATLGGVVVGLLASFWLARLVENQLYGISATDPLTMVAVSVLLVVVALVAAYLPARRAAKVDPVVALRYE